MFVVQVFAPHPSNPDADVLLSTHSFNRWGSADAFGDSVVNKGLTCSYLSDNNGSLDYFRVMTPSEVRGLCFYEED